MSGSGGGCDEHRRAVAHALGHVVPDLAVYALAVQIRARTGNVLCNPVLISTLVLMGYLKVFAIDYELYHSASRFIDFWLKPAVVLLAVPLYRNWDRIRSQWLPVVLSQLAGSVTGIVTGVYFAKWPGRFARSDFVAGFQIRDQPDCDRNHGVYRRYSGDYGGNGDYCRTFWTDGRI